MNTFYKSIVSENFKIKRNMMFLALCFFPLAITLMYFILYNFTEIPNSNFWLYSIGNLYMFYPLLYPVILSFIAYVYVNLEIKNNFHKQIFCLPINPYKIYLAKCSVLFYYYTVSIIVAYISYIMSIYILGAYIPDIAESVGHYDSKHLIDALFLKTYIVLLPLVFMQYTISLILPKVWLPSSLALFLAIIGMLLYKNEYFYLLPQAALYKIAYIDLLHENIMIFDKVFTTSIIYSMLFIAIGFFAFKRSKNRIDS